MATWQDIKKTQPLAGKIIANSIERDRLSHAYLLQGSRGTGKKTIAKLLSMTILCVSRNGIEPCGTCSTCQRIKSGNHPDVHWLEPEGQSIKKGAIDSIRKEFNFTAFEQEKKVYIITNAELLTVNAANQILKYLEEPDQNITAILLTNNGSSILKTIQSRCQIIDLQPLDETAFQHRLLALKEPLITENNARLLSALTNNIDEAITYHEEEKVYQTRELIKDLIYTLLAHYEERYLFVHEKWFPQLTDRQSQEQGLELLLLALRDMVNYQIGREDGMLFFHSDDGLLKRSVMTITKERLVEMIRHVLEAKQKMQRNIHPTLLMEQLVLKF